MSSPRVLARSRHKPRGCVRWSRPQRGAVRASPTGSSQQRQLTWDRQILYDEVAGLSSPQYLAANASALGMVISEAPTFLRLSDGALVGASQAAGWQSSIDAVGRGAVANALITQTPLVTDPAATIEGTPVEVTDETGQSVIPPALTDGLPTPTTR